MSGDSLTRTSFGLVHLGEPPRLERQHVGHRQAPGRRVLVAGHEGGPRVLVELVAGGGERLAQARVVVDQAVAGDLAAEVLGRLHRGLDLREGGLGPRVVGRVGELPGQHEIAVADADLRLGHAGRLLELGRRLVDQRLDLLGLGDRLRLLQRDDAEPDVDLRDLVALHVQHLVVLAGGVEGALVAEHLGEQLAGAVVARPPRQRRFERLFHGDRRAASVVFLVAVDEVDLEAPVGEGEPAEEARQEDQDDGDPQMNQGGRGPLDLRGAFDLFNGHRALPQLPTIAQYPIGPSARLSSPSRRPGCRRA